MEHVYEKTDNLIGYLTAPSNLISFMPATWTKRSFISKELKHEILRLITH